MPNQGIAHADEYKSEIARYEERLASIRHEVDEITKIKHTAHSSATDAVNHANWLDAENEKKDAEYLRKQEAIKALDAEIAAKQGQFDALQGEVSAANRELEDAKAEMQEIQNKVIEHTFEMSMQHQHLDEKRKITEENHRISEEKLQKIKELIKSLG